MSIREIFEELIKEAAKGSIVIDNETYNIGFNTLFNNNEFIGNINNPTLIVRDKNLFLDYLSQYIDQELETRAFNVVDEKEKIKKIMTYLFINMTPQEWNNPAFAIKRKIDFLKDDKLTEKKEIYIDFLDSNLVIERKQNNVSMETPYKMTFTLTKDENVYHLPSIYYGISEGTCYIYSIMNKDKNDVSDYAKRIKRALYKLNEGIYEDESDEYKAYKEGKSDYYPENISDVSPSFVLVAELFLKELSRNNINEVKLVPFLPIRYNSRDNAANGNEALMERNDNIQRNDTDKFIRTFMRTMHDLDGVEIKNYPYEVDEYMTFELYKVASREASKVK